MNIREVPAYDIVEAAHYLHLPKTTLRNWVYGHKKFKPVIILPDKQKQLSFINLIEAHMLSAIRREHEVPLQKVRSAIDYLEKQFGKKHPLANVPFETDKIDLFVRILGQIINVSSQGQITMKELVEAHLQRIQRDPEGFPIALYPFVSHDVKIDRKPVLFNPDIAFGRLVIAGTGIPTIEVAQRYKAGESIEQLAHDYARNELEIEDAIRCELQLEAA